MKKYNTLFVIILTMLFVTLMTWILPITYVNGEIITEARSQIGFVDLLTYPTFTFYNFINVFVYILVVGGFYGILSKTGAYRKLLDRIVKVVERKKILFTIITVLLLSMIVSITGFTYEFIIFAPFIISIVFMLGYDSITALLLVVGSVVTGIMGNTFSTIIFSSLSGQLPTLNMLDLIWFKVLMFFVTNAVLILNIIFYAKKHEANPVSENIFVPEKEKDSKIKVWPLVTILSITLVLVLLGTIDWDGSFKINFFVNFLEKYQSLTLFNYPVFKKVLGTFIAFGNWSYNELIVLLFFISLIIKFVYSVKLDELFDSAFAGIKNYVYCASVIMLAYGILIFTSNHPVLLALIKPLLLITDGFNSVTLSLGTLFSALFSTDFSFNQYAVLPFGYVAAYINDASVYGLCHLITTSMYGLAILIAPTSAILLFGLTTLKVSYLEWLKKIWKLFLELLVVAFVIFTIILLVI